MLQIIYAALRKYYNEISYEKHWDHHVGEACKHSQGNVNNCMCINK